MMRHRHDAGRTMMRRRCSGGSRVNANKGGSESERQPRSKVAWSVQGRALRTRDGSRREMHSISIPGYGRVSPSKSPVVNDMIFGHQSQALLATHILRPPVRPSRPHAVRVHHLVLLVFLPVQCDSRSRHSTFLSLSPGPIRDKVQRNRC